MIWLVWQHLQKRVVKNRSSQWSADETLQPCWINLRSSSSSARNWSPLWKAAYWRCESRVYVGGCLTIYVYIYIYTDHIQIHVSIIMHAPVDDLTSTSRNLGSLTTCSIIESSDICSQPMHKQVDQELFVLLAQGNSPCALEPVASRWRLRTETTVLKSEGFSNIFHTSSFFIVSSYFIRCSSYPIHPYPKVSRSTFLSEGWPTEATGSSSHGQNAGRADVQPGAEDLKNGYPFYPLFNMFLSDKLYEIVKIVSVLSSLSTFINTTGGYFSNLNVVIALPGAWQGGPQGCRCSNCRTARGNHIGLTARSPKILQDELGDAAMMLLCRFMICHVAAHFILGNTLDFSRF